MEAVTSYNSPDSKPSFGDTGEEEVVNLASNNPKKRAGRRKFQETRHPVYRGVRRRNSSWVCEVREPRKNSRIWLGTYPTLEMASRAHDVAAIALRGRSACLNFADSTWRLPVPASSNRDDIRKAAAEAAEAFRPQNLSEEGDDGAAVVDQSQSQSPENAQFSTDDQDNNQNDMEINSNEQEEKSTFMMDHHADVDDEALFGMHGLLASMAEGLMLQPPPQYIYDDVDADADVSLWSF